jgi:GTP-binding protein
MQDSILKNAFFIKSIKYYSQKPADNLPEIVIAGRSNSGKSTLINNLANNKKLAKVSSTPGKTRLINFCVIDKKFYLVDLPGYGFAKISHEEKSQWESLIESYLKVSTNLKIVCLLIDSRHGILQSDRQMMEWLNYFHRPYIIILTKSDKITINQLKLRIQNLVKELPDHHIFAYSIKSTNYRQVFIEYIYNLLG